MQDFTYHRPTSLDQAAKILAEADEGKLLAGGQSLLPVMKLDMAAPSDLIALSGIVGLGDIARDGDTLTIGATATHAAVADSDVVQDAISGLAELVGHIGDPQVRNRGTLGGSVAHNDPAADYPAAVLGLGATVVTNKREIAADDYFVGMFETALDEHEIITAVRFPVPRRAAYAKFANPASKYAIAGVMVVDTGEGVRVAVTGAGESVFRFTEAEVALAKNFSADALTEVSTSTDGLIGDLHASAEYRAHLIGVLTRRAVAAAG